MRRSSFLFALLALQLCAQTTPPFTCAVSISGAAATTAPAPAVMRAEGFADLTSDVLVTCTGGFSSVDLYPPMNLTVTMNAPLNSRILPTSAAPNASEALLLVNDPSPTSQVPCGNPVTGCAPYYPFGNAAIPNVFQGLISGTSVTFNGVPVIQPGANNRTVYRITNLRVNGAAGGAITATVSTAGSALPISAGNPATVATVQSGMSVSAQSTTLTQCSNANLTRLANLAFAENFSSAFKTRTLAQFVDVNTSPAPVPQPTPGTSYAGTETGFYNPALGQAAGVDPSLGTAGLADSGTRLKAVFSNIPAGVSLFVGIVNDGASSTSAARLTASETGPFSPVPGANGVAQLTVSGGTATAVWEVLAASPTSVVSLSFPIYVSYSGTPGLGTMLVMGSFAPVTGAGVPRFGGGIQPTGILSILPCPLVITTTSLPGGSVQVPYSATLAASGGVPPYTWSSSGSVPPGLTLSAGGAITGTPTTAGVYSFTAIVSDSVQTLARQALSITITAPPVSLVTTTLPAATVGVAYGTQLQATGGTPPYTWSLALGILPIGLTLDSLAGTITGTPAAAGQYPIVVQVSDTTKQSASRGFTLTVVTGLGITPTSLPAATLGAAYQQSLTASGGTAPYTWSISAGALPPGLNFSGGVISGTPTTIGTYKFTVAVADSTGLSGSAALQIDVRAAALAITTASPLPDAPVNLSLSIAFAATGGVPPYTWTLGTGSLPPGTAFSGGTLSGTPTTPGAYSFTIQVTDSTGASAGKSFSLNITPLKIAPDSLPTGTVGTSYSAAFSATGGVAPYTWTVSGLPAGLSFDSTQAAISGTPTTAGTFSVTAQVTDSAKATASHSYSLVINPAALSITTTTLPAGTVGAAYNTGLAASGGRPPYSWALAGGTLPSGITLAAAGTLQGTPTAAGTFPFIVKVSDAANASATKAVSIVVAAAIRITTASPLPDAMVGQAYSQTLAASGGSEPYTWSASGLPAGIGLDAAGGTLSGTPTESGTFEISVQVADASRATNSKTLRLVVALPAVPQVTFSGVPTSTGAAQQFNVQLRLGANYPTAVSGRITLTFAPDSGLTDDPSVLFSAGGRTADFTIPTGANTAQFTVPQLGVQTGTVAGVITLTATFAADGHDITPSPAPATTIRVARAAPSISSVKVTRTATGFDVQITAFATGRQITRTAFHFTGSAGGNLQTSDLSVDASSLFSTWYGNASSAAYGSQFTYVQPFVIQGDSNAVASVSVTLANDDGTSQPVSANLP